MFSKGVRKYIREEKGRIRRQVSGLEKQKVAIADLLKRFTPAHA